MCKHLPVPSYRALLHLKAFTVPTINYRCESAPAVICTHKTEGAKLIGHLRLCWNLALVVKAFQCRLSETKQLFGGRGFPPLWEHPITFEEAQDSAKGTQRQRMSETGLCTVQPERLTWEAANCQSEKHKDTWHIHGGGGGLVCGESVSAQLRRWSLRASLQAQLTCVYMQAGVQLIQSHSEPTLQIGHWPSKMRRFMVSPNLWEMLPCADIETGESLP